MLPNAAGNTNLERKHELLARSRKPCQLCSKRTHSIVREHILYTHNLTQHRLARANPASCVCMCMCVCMCACMHISGYFLYLPCVRVCVCVHVCVCACVRVCVCARTEKARKREGGREGEREREREREREQKGQEHNRKTKPLDP